MGRNRKNKSKELMALVPVKAVSSGGGRSRRKRRNRKRKGRPGGGGPASHWQVALQHPFGLAAEGAKVPDSCSIPTTTFTVTQKLGFQSDSGGIVDMICMPSLATAIWSPRASLVGDTYQCYYGAVGSPVTGGNAMAFDIAGLGAIYQRFRIVGWGVRIRSTAGINSPGEFFGAAIAASGLAPGNTKNAPAIVDPTSSTARGVPSYLGTAGPIDTAQNYLASLGIPYSGINNSAVVDNAKIVVLPHHGIASHSQVSARGLHMRSFPFEPDAHRFKTVAFTSTGTDSVDCYSSLPTSLSQQYAVNMDPWKVNGFESILISGVGFPASTILGTVEVIYHCEAVINPNAGLYHRAACTPSPVIPTEYDKVRQAIAHVAHVSFADAVQQGEDYVLGQVEGAVTKYGANAVSGLAGVLSRLLVAGG